MGYEALAESDAPAFGGNGNGWADPEDYHWQSLQLWVDRNHDGRSQQSEILTLAQAQVYALGILAEHHHQNRQME